ncbi:GPI biosynthesis protein family Pig-F-domain-containing protein [Immersiella caudata]|uniref:GPI biosynthesis protein family Pig-F-domain-containing protein n=1 Tax=Immersiella caudata TaxID=314043 RepID=A0AA40BTU4_9PEZI|nr:GPI biosynthesis protein family Pig-F-domain-containing protein [Immersiella caudata]
MPLVDPVTMSSSTIKSVAAQVVPQQTKEKETPAAPVLQPIQIKSTPAAQAARHGFPALLAAVFAVRFPTLVEDPVSAMLTTLPVIAAIQLAYALVCLPAVGSSSAKPSRKPRPGEKKKGGDGGPNLPVTIIVSLLLTTFITPALYVAFVCFGAPAYTYVSHTMLACANLAVLTLFPLFYVHGVDGAAWSAVFSSGAPWDETYGGYIGGFVGAWLGAVPIPLDWDREWQRWPVTILVGMYGGYLVGRVLGGTVFWGKGGRA